MEVCRLIWTGFYASAVLEHGCEKQALGEDVKAGRVLVLELLPAVLGASA